MTLRIVAFRFLPSFLIGLLLLFSFLPFLSGGFRFLYPFGDLFFSRICHGIEGRCFYINGFPMYICARCVGIYSGLFLGSIVYFFQKISFQRFLSRFYLLIAILPILIDKSLESFSITSFSKDIAFISGLLSGFLIFLYIANRFLINFCKRNDV